MADKKTKKFNQAAHNARMKELEKTQGLESVNPEMYMIPGGAAAKIKKNSPKIAKVLDFVGAPLTKKAKAGWLAADTAFEAAGYKKGGRVKNRSKAKGASNRADGCITKGKTKGRMV